MSDKKGSKKEKKVAEKKEKKVVEKKGGDKKKKQSVGMGIKKSVGSSVGTSKVGKALIKDVLGKNATLMLKIIRGVITAVDGKKKAAETEDALIKVGVKVILLWQNKDISNKQLRSLLPQLKALWSDAIDFCEMSFAYSPDSFAQKAKDLLAELEKLVAGGLMGEKNVKMMRETLDYLASERVLDALFKDEAQAALKTDTLTILRSAWIKVFKDAAK